MISDKQYHTIIEVLDPYDPERIGIFGSYARNEEKPDSDLNILVSFSKSLNLLQLIGLEQELLVKHPKILLVNSGINILKLNGRKWPGCVTN